MKLNTKNYEKELIKYRINRIKCYSYELLLLILGLFITLIINIDNNITTYITVTIIVLRGIIVIHWLIESLFLRNDSIQIFEKETGYIKMALLESALELKKNKK